MAMCALNEAKGMDVIMEEKFTDEEIKKALEQADANMNFEEVQVSSLEKEETKILRKELKNG